MGGEEVGVVEGREEERGGRGERRREEGEGRGGEAATGKPLLIDSRGFKCATQSVQDLNRARTGLNSHPQVT